jgi:N-methylhydantoinase A
MVFERGLDVRRFSLFAYGGAGALHAAEVARSAGIAEVVVPQLAGGFSALGLATAPPKVERALSRVQLIDAFGLDELNALFAELEADVFADLESQGVTRDRIELRRSISAMYTGQGFANELELDEWPITAEVIERWKRRFDELYDRLYGYMAPEMGVTVATLEVSGSGPRALMNLPELAEGGAEPPAEARDGHHRLCLADGTPSEAPFYVLRFLLAGNVIEGPAVIEDDMTTILVPAESRATIDGFGNVRITFPGSSRG